MLPVCGNEKVKAWLALTLVVYVCHTVLPATWKRMSYVTPALLVNAGKLPAVKYSPTPGKSTIVKSVAACPD